MNPPWTAPHPEDLHEDRRLQEQASRNLLDEIEAKFRDGDARMTRMEHKIDANSSDTAQVLVKMQINSSDTAEVLEIVRLGKGFFRGLGHLANFIKAAVVIAAGIATLWGLWPKK